MKALAYALMICGIIVGLAVRFLSPENEGVYAVAGLVLLAGSLILLINAAIRLFRGEVKLRPLDALKKAVVLFLIILGLRALIWLGFPSLDRDLIAAVLWSATFAIAFGLYTTAYRRPA